MESPTWTTRRDNRLTAFGLVFAIPALLVVAFTVMKPLARMIDARDWIATSATLSEARLDTSSSGDGSTYRAVAQYHFDVDGDRFEGNRVSFHGGSDNIGSYQSDMAARLQAALQAGSNVPVFYDADNPAMAVLDRTLRVGLLAFTSVFGLIFGLMGGGLIWLGYRGHRVNESPEVTERPWLANPDWQGDKIVDDGRAQSLSLMLFAAIWNLISWPILAFTLAGDANKSWWVIALVALFPGAGILLVRQALATWCDFKKRGPAILQLEPTPGRVGGWVAGIVELPRVRPDSLEAACTLSALHTVRRRKSTHETALWQQTCPAILSSSSSGSRTEFRFVIPDGLPSSGRDNARSRHHWRLMIELRPVEGASFTRQFDIPVFAQAEGAIIDKGLPLDESPLKTDDKLADVASPTPGWEGIPRRDTYLGGVSLDYPAYHDPAVPAGGVCFGLAFTAIGSIMAWHASGDDWVLGLMSLPFLLFGVLIGVSSLIELLSSRRVLIDARTISAEHRILGFRTKGATIKSSDVSGFDLERRGSLSSNGRHRLFYRVHATLNDGSRLDVGWRIESESRARNVIAWLAANTGGVSSSLPVIPRFGALNDDRHDAA